MTTYEEYLLNNPDRDLVLVFTLMEKGRILIDWTDWLYAQVNTFTGIEIQRKRLSTDTYVTIETLGSKTTSYVDRTAPTDYDCYYNIRGIITVGSYDSIDGYVNPSGVIKEYNLPISPFIERYASMYPIWTLAPVRLTATERLFK
jgi:hypothetical protein